MLILLVASAFAGVAFAQSNASAPSTAVTCTAPEKYLSCSDCQKNGCSWYKAATLGLGGSKCDQPDITIDLIVYSKEDTCPKCAFTDCTLCTSSSDNCNWHISAATGTTWPNGGCKPSAELPASTFKIAHTCSAACSGIKSCKDCNQNKLCGWYTKPLMGDGDCQLLESKLIASKVDDCPACAASTCTACYTTTAGAVAGNGTGGCKYFSNKMTGIGRCATENPSSVTLSGRNQSECAALESGANANSVSFVALAFLVATVTFSS